MSGLVAVIARDRTAPIEPGEASALADTYESLRGAGQRAAVSAGTLAEVVLLASEHEAAPKLQKSPTGWVALAGRAHGPELSGLGGPEDLDGHFALVVWHEAEQEIVVATDAFAMQALYVAERGEKTYVSTSALALAKFLQAPPDRDALLAYLRAGYHFGSLTHWAGIKRLEPAEELSFGPRGVRRRIYWRPSIDQRFLGLSLEETAEACLDEAVATYSKFLRSPTSPWSDLTAGYDTRLLNLLLRRAGVDFATDTRGDEEGTDLRVARRVAQLTGWEWTGLTLPEDWDEVLSAFLPVALAWGDGQLDVLELSWVLWAHSQLSRKRRTLFYAGGGEHFRDFAWRQEFLRPGRSNVVNLDNWVDMRLLNPMRTSLFAQDPTPAVRADFGARMTRWAEPYADELNTTQLDVMYAYKVTGRSADNAFLAAELPFYFKPVFTAAFSSHFRHRNRHRLMRELLWRLDRRVASVATSAGGPAEPWRLGNLHRVGPYYLQLGHRATNKLSEKLVGRALLPPAETYDWWCPPAARAVVLGMLAAPSNGGSHGLRAEALFDRPELDRFFDEARRSDFRDVSVLGRIATVELALRAVGTGVEG
jgi:glutamine amidotransferase-like protein